MPSALMHIKIMGTGGRWLTPSCFLVVGIHNFLTLGTLEGLLGLFQDNFRDLLTREVCAFIVAKNASFFNLSTG